MHDVRLTVNGHARSATVDARVTLADFLREQCHLTGTHLGCEHGVCGACTVLWNGRAVRSCIMLAVQADGGTIMTVEGLGREGALHPIQQAFLEEHGLQCGFCTPGILMTVSALLVEHPRPSDEEIRVWLAGNLCRCTGYVNIVRAVRRAGALLAARRAPVPPPVEVPRS
jgi:carbon-monoxide dehydrogenase small subunit